MLKHTVAHTITKEQETVMVWKLDNLASVCDEISHSLDGPDITLPTNPETIWRTSIQFKHDRDYNTAYTFRAHGRDTEHPLEFRINYDLSIGNRENDLVSVTSNCVQKGFKPCIVISFLLNDNVIGGSNTYLFYEDFILKCRFGVVFTSTLSHVTTHKASSQNDFNRLSDNLKTLYVSQSFSDFTIVVEGKSFPVHKCILSSRSPVFAAMFESDTVELSSKTLIVDDFNIKTMEAFLLFLYTDQLGEISADEYCQLYSVSDKYALVFLKEISAHKLIKSIGVDNVCDVYTLGHFHNDLILKSAAKSYVKRNALSVLISENWKNLISQNSQIAAQLLKEAEIH